MNRDRDAIALRLRSALATSLLASTVLAGATAAYAEDKKPGTTEVTEVIVTAQKRAESLQKVPMSIQALDATKLQQLNVTQFNDYVKYLPSVSFQSEGPNSAQVFIRGVASGENGNHSGPLPTVGVYLDEQPITTIGGTLDAHVYDMERVEVLAGPQGTLYGASSEAGTIRFITKKPTHTFSAGVDLQGNTVHGDGGYVGEGFVNLPVTDKIAVRLVGWAEHDAGYIDNVLGSRTFATSGDTITNAAFVKKNFNPADTIGGRAALKVDLSENWTVLAQVFGQDQRNTGVFGYERDLGRLKVQRFGPDTDHDRWIQAALTVTGKIGKYDVTYSGGYHVRQVDSRTDYTDYSYFYDLASGYGKYWEDAHGNPLANPSQYIVGVDKFTKESHEFRVQSPKTDRLRILLGAFQQRQTHWIVQDYKINGLGIDTTYGPLTVPGWNQTLWLTDQMRVDRDYAVFGELSFDIMDRLQITGGMRGYTYDNSLKGFFGFSENYANMWNGRAGVAQPGMGVNGSNCISLEHYRGDPCVNLDKTVKGKGETHRLNLTYKFDNSRLIYATYSTGFRPGGVNRNGNFGPYGADFLTNYEVGWKTSWFGNSVRWNGAIFDEDWRNFQFSFLGPNSLTIVQNAGQANAKGVESDVTWRVTPQFTLTGSGAYTEAKLTSPYCKFNDASHAVCPEADSGQTNPPLPNPLKAPKGAQLPITPKVKVNATARYTFDLMGWNAHAQGAVIYQDRSFPALKTSDVAALGVMPSYTTVDLSAGAEKGTLSLELFVKNLLDSNGQVTRYSPCGGDCTGTTPANPGVPAAIYYVPVTPRMIGVKLSKKF